MILIDLQKAFEIIEHDTLLAKMKGLYPISQVDILY